VTNSVNTNCYLAPDRIVDWFDAHIVAKEVHRRFLLTVAWIGPIWFLHDFPTIVSMVCFLDTIDKGQAKKKFRQFLDHFFFVFLTIGETGRFTGANQFQFKSFSKSNFGRFLTGFFGFRPNRPDRFWVR
jgi:hypothetical protein